MSSLVPTEGTRRLVVMGGGPIGIEMCLQALREKESAAHCNFNFHVTLLERGAGPGHNCRKWSHVKFFSSWALNVTELGLAVLDEAGVPRPPPEGFPTGEEFIEQYLRHLWAYLEAHERCSVRPRSRVVSATRGVLLKGDMGSAKRGRQPFRILVATSGAGSSGAAGGGDEDEEDEVILEADAVVDATGTYGQRNWLGAGGMPALGERGCCLLGSKRGAAADDDNNSDTSGPLIEDVIPDVLSAARRGDFTGEKTVVLVGSGYSAVTTLDLIRRLHLGEEEEQQQQQTTTAAATTTTTTTTTTTAKPAGVTTVVWATRRAVGPAAAGAAAGAGAEGGGELYERIENDPLPARDALSALANGLLLDAGGAAGGEGAGGGGGGAAVGGGGGTVAAAAAAAAGSDVKYATLAPTLRVRHIGGVQLHRISRRTKGRAKKKAKCSSGSSSSASSGGNEGSEEGGAGGAERLELEFMPCGDAATRNDAAAAAAVVKCDRVVANVGFRPDASLYQELQVHQCYASEGPMKLAAALLSSAGAGSSDCLAQVSPGPGTLVNPEPGFFIVGMKSYGRGSKFLLRVGHEQVAMVHGLLLKQDC